ncbi:MAG: CHASE2 domain-containing protein, partial [Muribaculaceae bacterium]|nr:CHASE2 domain-containing protein [Muribaculaceae bacterium]
SLEKVKKTWEFVKSPVVFRPLVATIIAIGLMHFFATDINSDMVMGTLCGSSDVEVSDFYNRVRAGGSQKTLDDNIVIVNIDSVFGRDEIAILLSQVSDANPKAICLDVLLEEEKEPESDMALADIMSGTPHLVVSQRYSDANIAPVADFTQEFSPDVARGMANLTSTKAHGLVREVTPFFGKNKQYPGLAAAMLKEIDTKSYNYLKGRGAEEEMIRFQPEEFYVAEPDEIWNNSSILTGKIVFLGTINEESDLHPTPISDDYPGVMIQANILSMMLQRDYINDNSETYNILLLLISCLLMTVLYVYLDAAQNLVMRILPIIWMGIILYLGCWAFNKFGIYLNAPRTMILSALALFVLDIWYAFEGPIGRLWRKIRHKCIISTINNKPTVE